MLHTGWACYEPDFRGSVKKRKILSNFIIPRARGRRRARGPCNMTRQLEAT